MRAGKGLWECWQGIILRFTDEVISNALKVRQQAILFWVESVLRWGHFWDGWRVPPSLVFSEGIIYFLS